MSFVDSGPSSLHRSSSSYHRHDHGFALVVYWRPTPGQQRREAVDRRRGTDLPHTARRLLRWLGHRLSHRHTSRRRSRRIYKTTSSPLVSPWCKSERRGVSAAVAAAHPPGLFSVIIKRARWTVLCCFRKAHLKLRRASNYQDNRRSCVWLPAFAGREARDREAF